MRRLSALCALLFLAAPLSAQREVRIRHMDVQYELLSGGDAEVTERFQVRFDGAWNGLERILLARAASSSDTADFRPIDIDVHGATDTTGRELRVETDRDGADIAVRIYVPDANDADRTVVLRYRVHDAITFFDDHDEFYWNVTGQDWRSTIDSVDVRAVGPAAPDSVLVWAGGSFKDADAVQGVSDGIARATTTDAVSPGEGMTVALWWPAGTFRRPGALESIGDWIATWWPVMLPFLAVGFMWRRWRLNGRDPRQLPIVARYEPPERLTPGEVGAVLDERADMRDVTATLVDLAVKGHMRIEEIDGTNLLGMELGRDFRFVRQDDADDADLTAHERLLMSALFHKHGSGGTVELSDLKNEFYKDLPAIRDAMMDALVEHGYYEERPDRQRVIYLFLAGAAFGLVFPLAGWMASRGAGWAPVALPALTALPIAIFGWLMPARTMRGTRVFERVMGFREFLARVDGDRLRRMAIAPDFFEKGLPYAMAMGEEKRWASAFQGLAQEPPRWYVGHHGAMFDPSAFVSDLSTMSAQTSSAMSSSPGGGGSGFGGGGGVGGGGGGGGGGGF